MEKEPLDTQQSSRAPTSECHLPTRKHNLPTFSVLFQLESTWGIKQHGISLLSCKWAWVKTWETTYVSYQSSVSWAWWLWFIPDVSSFLCVNHHPSFHIRSYTSHTHMYIYIYLCVCVLHRHLQESSQRLKASQTQWQEGAGNIRTNIFLGRWRALTHLDSFSWVSCPHTAPQAWEPVWWSLWPLAGPPPRSFPRRWSEALRQCGQPGCPWKTHGKPLKKTTHFQWNMGVNSELHFIPCLFTGHYDILWWLWWTCSYWILLQPLIPAPITISYPPKNGSSTVILHDTSSIQFSSFRRFQAQIKLHFSRWHTQSWAPPRSFPCSELPLWEFPSRLRCIPPVAPPRYCHGSPAGPPAPLWSPAWHLTDRHSRVKPMGKTKKPLKHKDWCILKCHLVSSFGFYLVILMISYGYCTTCV